MINFKNAMLAILMGGFFSFITTSLIFALIGLISLIQNSGSFISSSFLNSPKAYFLLGAIWGLIPGGVSGLVVWAFARKEWPNYTRLLIISGLAGPIFLLAMTGIFLG